MPQINIETLLREVGRCPVCGSEDRQRNSSPRKHISPYTRALAKAAELSPEALLQYTILWDCRVCGAVWHDPWLKSEIADTLYGYVCGMHFYGWLSLAAWLDQKPTPILANRDSIWKYLRSHHQGSMTYAELNCPHTGLVFAEFDAQIPLEKVKIARRRLSDLQRVHAVSGLLERAHAKFMDLSEIVQTNAGGDFLVHRTLLTEDSDFCWRRSCIHRGASCHAFAQGFLFDRMVPLASAEASGERFDLIGAFQTVDHMPDPLGTVRRLLKLGSCVLLEMHTPGWTDLQHLYGLGHGFADLLAGEGVYVRNLTTVAHSHGLAGGQKNSFFMFSREDDLSWLPAEQAV